MKILVQLLMAQFVLANLIIAQAETRHALIIGIGDYEEFPDEYLQVRDLPNAARDARMIHQVLTEDLNFNSTLLINPTADEIFFAVEKLNFDVRKDKSADFGLLYFAGHGIQNIQSENGIEAAENFLIPADAMIRTNSDFKRKTVPLSDVVNILSPRLEGLPDVKAPQFAYIIDACRNNYRLPENFSNSPAGRSLEGSRGLAEVKSRPGVIISYSTSPGHIANDGEPGTNSPFAHALVDELSQAQGTSIFDVLMETTRNVVIETEGKQLPWLSASLVSPIYLGSKGDRTEKPVYRELPSTRSDPQYKISGIVYRTSDNEPTRELRSTTGPLWHCSLNF